MPIKNKINPSERVIYTTTYGKVTDNDLAKFKLVLQNDPDFNPDFKELFDLHSV